MRCDAVTAGSATAWRHLWYGLLSAHIGALAEHGKVAPVTIHHRVDFAASMTDGRTVAELAPQSPSAQEITSLWKYVFTQLRKYAKGD